MLILKRVQALMGPFLMVLCLLTASPTGEKDQPICKDKDKCLNDPNCLCWCSQICNYRKKLPSDHPVYIENDPHGKYCYCKQWDYDNYEANCIRHEHIKEPPGAK